MKKIFILLLSASPLFSQTVRLVKEFEPGSDGAFNETTERIIGVVNNRAVFTLKAGNQLKVWASDGRKDSVWQIYSPFSGKTLERFEVVGNYVYFYETDQSQTSLFRTNGASIEQLIFDAEGSVSDFVVKGDTIFYLLTYAGGFTQLRYRDPASGFGDVVYDDFGTFYYPLDMELLTDDTFVFLASTSEGRCLFKSDGTYAGTATVKLINNGSEFSQITYMTRVGNKVFFFYKFPGDDASGYFLYVTDGTEQGTLSLKEFEFVPFKDFKAMRAILGWDGKFYFKAQPIGNSNNEEELWVSDGTANGTVSLEPDPNEHTRPAYLTPYHSKLYFKGDYAGYIFGLFKTTGTAGSTTLEATGTSLGTGFDFGVDYLTVFRDSLVFTGYRNQFGGELCFSDGTEEGTRLLNIVPGNLSSFPQYLAAADSLLFFIAQTPPTGNELYVYDPFDTSVAAPEAGSYPGELKIYPNPAGDFIRLDYDGRFGKAQTLDIRSIEGQVVCSWQQPASQNYFSVEHLTAGIYRVELRAEQGVMVQKLVVK